MSNQTHKMTAILQGLKRQAIAGAAFAAVGLLTGAVLSPGIASAAPADDGFIDPQLFIDQFPIPFPFPIPEPEPAPGPDDGPDPFPWGPGEIPIEIDFQPFDPSDWVLAPPDDDGDDDDDEPACNEYSGANFSVGVNRYDADLIEVQLAYTDPDVCDYTVWVASFADEDADPFGQTTIGMGSIAFATDSAGYYQTTFSDEDRCSLLIKVAVEESLPMSLPYADDGCDDDEPADAPVDDGDEPADDGDEPADDGDEPADDGDEPADDGDEPADDGDEPVDDGDEPVDDGDEPVDDGDEPVDDGDEPADDETESIDEPLADPETPGTPSGGLPSTGSNMTRLMLGLGFLTLGAGSIVALATRRSDDPVSV